VPRPKIASPSSVRYNSIEEGIARPVIQPEFLPKPKPLLEMVIEPPAQIVEDPRKKISDIIEIDMFGDRKKRRSESREKDRSLKHSPDRNSSQDKKTKDRSSKDRSRSPDRKKSSSKDKKSSPSKDRRRKSDKNSEGELQTC
jgi:hypothetical protein